MLKNLNSLALIIIFSLFVINSAKAASIAQTQIKIFAPFSGQELNPNLIVKEKIKGDCWTTSIAIERRNAYRCMSDNNIYDPCFVNQTQNLAVCSLKPWTQEVILMQLTKPVPPPEATPINKKNARPWMIELVNGQHCNFITGASSEVSGMRMNYSCDNGGYLLGQPDYHQSVWEIYYQIHNSALKRLPIKTVWY